MKDLLLSRGRVPRGAWIIIALIVGASALNYFDRNLVAVLKPALKSAFGLSDRQYSWIVAAFMTPYVLMYLIGGRLVDRLGSRVTLTLFLGFWSVATACTGLVGGLQGLLACRFVLGVMEPGGFIACQRAIVAWFPRHRRGLAIGIFSLGTPLGTILAPPVIAAVTGSLGWRWAFFLPGAVGIALAGLWWLTDFGTPKIDATEATVSRATPLRDLLRCRALWGLLLARVVSDPVWIFFQFWLPGYFQERLGFTLAEYGRIGWIPAAVATGLGLGLAFGCDWRIARGGDPLLTRRNALLFFTALAPVGFLTPFVASPWLVLAIITTVYAVAHIWYLFNSLIQTDLFPPGSLGTALGLIGACGSLGGLAFNLAMGWGVERYGYRPILMASGALHPIAALIVWWLVREPFRISPAIESPNIDSLA